MNSENKILRLSSRNLKQEEFYPYIAYIKENGAPSDTMFSNLILDYSGVESRLSDWEKVIYALFREGENLRALESAMADVKALLNLPADYKCNIYIAPPVPAVSREYFGDINGNGIAEKILDKDDCVRAFAWLANNFNRRFKACGFDNIILKGWYLQAEDEDYCQVVSNLGYEVLSADNCNQAEIEVIENPPAAGVYVFNETEDKPLLASAVSAEARDVYESIYGFINCENTAPIIEILAEPQVFTEPEEFAEPKISADLIEQVFALEETAESPAEEQAPPALETISQKIETIFLETESEQIPDSEQAYQPCEDASATEDIPQETKATVHASRISEPAENLKSIVLDIDISTGSPCPPPCRVPPPPPPAPEAPPAKKPMSREKKLAIGAGIAAAVLGIAYLIKKSDK